MYFNNIDDDFRDDEFIGIENPNIIHFINREIFALETQFAVRTESFMNRSTHTEDGIPIRKLYVSNLPPKATRNDLFVLFAQYGFIKSCWLRIGERGPNKNPAATYAFVTYTNPADAHKALVAPTHEKVLGGRNLRVSPADSWHQPAEEADGTIRWNPRSLYRPEDSYYQGTVAENADAGPVPSCSKAVIPVNPEIASDAEEPEYTIMDVLNPDCLSHVLGYVPIIDLIRSESVSKRWQGMVQDYISNIRTFKTSWWRHGSLTTGMLRRLLARTGESITRLHIDQHWTALNDRTAHTVGKFCPNLEELVVVGMLTKNWNPLIYGCKQLRIYSFISCNMVTDSSLVEIVRNDSVVESMTISNNSHITGQFLAGSDAPKLNSLAFYNCHRLQGTVLCSAMDSLPNLTTLKIDRCPLSMLKMIPIIVNKLPALRELSLSEHMWPDYNARLDEDFKGCFTKLSELRVLTLYKNVYVTNAMLKQVAQSCPNLQTLNISSCNSYKRGLGVGDEGILAVCNSCHVLTHLNVSYLAALSDVGLGALPRLPYLSTLVARGNTVLSAAPLAAALAQCPELQEIDVCGCFNVSEEIAEAAWRAVQVHPRPLTLRLAGTATSIEDLPRYHKLLVINVDEDLSDPNLRPDLEDVICNDSSEDSFGDLYDEDDYVEFLMEDEFVDGEDLNGDLDDLYAYGIHAYGLHAQDIILL